MKLLFVYTVEASLRTAVRGQIRHLVDRGHEVHVAVSPGGGARAWVEEEGGAFHAVSMSRSIRDLVGDARALRALSRLIRDERPDLVVCGSPKAGMLGALAGRRERVPVLYFLHGLRFEGASGSARRALIMLEWLTCRLASRVVAVGHGLRTAAVDSGVVSAERVDVVGKGSANGIAIAKFTRAGPPAEQGPTFGFAGRITADKGVADLARAWRIVHAQLPDSRLVVLGDADSDDLKDLQLVTQLAAAGADLRGYVADPAPLIQEFDVLVLPSRREGFPTVVLEAAAAGVPAIMYSCTGSDVVVDRVTGRLVEVGNWKGLADAMIAVGGSPKLMRALGEHARERVTTGFAQGLVWTAYEEHYRHVVRSNMDRRAS